MNTPTLKLRLGPKPKTSQTKITFSCTTVLLEDLQRYATQYSQAYDEPIDVAELVPHMLATFMARDRAFKRTEHASCGPQAISASPTRPAGPSVAVSPHP